MKSDALVTNYDIIEGLTGTISAASSGRHGGVRRRACNMFCHLLYIGEVKTFFFLSF